MIPSLFFYVACRYGSVVTQMLTEQYRDEFPFMDGYDMATLLPENHITRAGISPGLLPDVINEGGIVK